MSKNTTATAREKHVTLDVAADYFSVSRRTLERFIDSQKIPAYRLGRSVRVRLSELEAALTPLGSAR
ncbi:helix-turn-helix domain-containing protein [Corynebacterium sp. H127]|uniref:helix-turn-helix domain-containing protein n=1 Tax=Corynebacterium sp. H127 TaxID=3133418 RepID=UPI0030B7C927